MRGTHTYATLEVSESAYGEIRSAFFAAGYDHAIHNERGGREVIDMAGIALMAAKASAPRTVPPAENRPTITVVSCSQESDPWAVHHVPYAAAIYIQGFFHEHADSPLVRRAWDLSEAFPVKRITQCQVQWHWFESRNRRFPYLLADIHPDERLPEFSPGERLAVSLNNEERYAPRAGSIAAPVEDLPF